MQRRNPSAVLRPGFSGSQRLPRVDESWRKAQNLGGMGAEPHLQESRFPRFISRVLSCGVKSVIGMMYALFAGVIIRLDVIPAGRYFSEVLPFLPRGKTIQ